jgi:hypothetical protein
MTSVTFVMKILPLSWSLLFLLRGLGFADFVLSFLSLLLFGKISLQQSRIASKRYISYYREPSQRHRHICNFAGRGRSYVFFLFAAPCYDRVHTMQEKTPELVYFMVLPIVHADDQFFQGLVQEITVDGLVRPGEHPLGSFNTSVEI